MTRIWASRAGLSKTELLEITDLALLQWAPIDLAMEKTFRRNGCGREPSLSLSWSSIMARSQGTDQINRQISP
jgi:hypothetical protein